MNEPNENSYIWEPLDCSWPGNIAGKTVESWLGVDKLVIGVLSISCQAGENPGLHKYSFSRLSDQSVWQSVKLVGKYDRLLQPQP